MPWNKGFYQAALLGLLLTTFSQAETIYVTGNPASASFLREVLESKGWNVFPSGPLAVGRSWSPKPGKEVINLDWSAPPVALAALSDHPEDVDRRGQLFSGGLSNLRPVRLQYYHLGSLKGPSPTIWLQINNPTTTPARIHLTQAVGKPSTDYFSTGHTNNVAWFEKALRGEGQFFDIRPGETRTIFSQDLPLEKVVSGTLTLTSVSGSPLTYQLVAAPDHKESVSLNNLLKEKDVHSRGFYPVAVQQIRTEHTIGSEETRVTVGGLRQETFYGVRELRGDYGILYDLEIDLVNPTPRSAQVELLFNPRGGAATATILMDATIVEVPQTEAFAESRFATLDVPAHSSRRLLLQTVPEGASSYPVRIVLRDHKITREIPGRTEGNSRDPLEILHVRRVSDVDY